ncbi:MAG: hypothetical protein U0411_03080 [Thermodesulfovibrionales bacterium]
MMKKYISLILLLLPALSYGDMGDFAEDYLRDMEVRSAAVFYSQCESKPNGQYTATLIFEAGSTRGLLIERKDKTVVNLATVMLGEKGLTIEETHGGVYTYDRVKKLVDELAGYNFIFLSPLRVKALESSRTNNV